MLSVLLTILHVMICLFLIVVVLLQAGKGGGVGAAFGASGSGSMFGARGPATFLSKMTAAMAGMFMLTSVFLSLSATQQDSKLGKKHGKKKKPVAAAGAVAGQAGSSADGGAAEVAPDGSAVKVAGADGGVTMLTVPPVPTIPPGTAGAGAGANVPPEIRPTPPTPPEPPRLPARLKAVTPPGPRGDARPPAGEAAPSRP